MSSDTVITYTWKQLNEDIAWLGTAVVASKFEPHEIVGLVRGGLVPGVMLSHILSIPLTPLKWSVRDRLQRDFGGWMALVEAAYSGRRILLVEDIVDSGETFREMLRVGCEYFNHKIWMKNIRIAALWANEVQDVHVDYVKNTINRDNDLRWVVFPWEVCCEVG